MIFSGYLKKNQKERKKSRMLTCRTSQADVVIAADVETPLDQLELDVVTLVDQPEDHQGVVDQSRVVKKFKWIH